MTVQPAKTQQIRLPMPEGHHPFKRYRCMRSTVVRLIARPHFHTYRASVEDVSMREIGLVLNRSFDAGTKLALLLQTHHAGLSDILSAKVKSTRQLEEGRWLMDCTLGRSLSLDEILAMI